MEHIADLVAHLQQIGQRDQRLIACSQVPARAASVCDWPEWVTPRLAENLKFFGAERAWSHQVQMAQLVREGRHAILTSGTGSGKSLAVWVPYLSALEEAGEVTGKISQLRARPYALYLAPTKALAADQVAALTRLTRGGPAPMPVRVGAADGDADRASKDWVRANADIVATNPDFLHYSLLPAHARWRRFLSGLQLIVLDEAHHYRGVFGAHVCLVLRRLLRVCRLYGSAPTVAFLSATMTDPVGTAQRFLGPGAPVSAVTEDGSPTGEHTVMVWQPALVEDPSADEMTFDPWKVGADPKHTSVDSSAEATAPDSADDPFSAGPVAGQDAATNSFDPWESANEAAERYSVVTEAANLTAEMVSEGAQVLTFVRSRNGTEAIADMAESTLRRLRRENRTNRETLAQAQTELNEKVGGKPRQERKNKKEKLAGKRQVAAYRGGYLPEERRALEAALRSGELKALASTSALELGIDVSTLDATVTAGWPGTLASLRQQMGRAGRAGKDGVSVVIVGDDPIEAYLGEHPEVIFNPVESTVFNPRNPYILGPHLCAAASEVPLTAADVEVFELPGTEVLAALTQAGRLLERPDGWYWNPTQDVRPQDLTDLRGAGFEVQLVEQGTGRVVGSVNSSRVDAVAHPGAIYVHQGRVYEVLGRDQDVAVLGPGKPKLRTRPWITTDVRILSTLHERSFGRDSAGKPLLTWHFGQVEVVKKAQSYDLLRLPGLQFIKEVKLDLPERTMITEAVWWYLSKEVVSGLGLGDELLPGALHAAEHAMIGILPLLATCDRWDLGGLSTSFHAGTARPTVFVYDGTAGGAGFAERGFEIADQWVGATLETVAGCECAEGCPRCVVSPKCGNNNEPLYKRGAADLLTYLHGFSG